MTKPIRILLQTTIPFAEDNWHIGRFSLLRDELSSMKDKAGNQLCEVTTRDHEDLGISLCTLGGIGRAHFFHTKHPEPDASRHVPDDQETTSISWPNYHSGANGDYQTIAVTFPHEVLRRTASADDLIEFF